MTRRFALVLAESWEVVRLGTRRFCFVPNLIAKFLCLCTGLETPVVGATNICHKLRTRRRGVVALLRLYLLDHVELVQKIIYSKKPVTSRCSITRLSLADFDRTLWREKCRRFVAWGRGVLHAFA